MTRMPSDDTRWQVASRICRDMCMGRHRGGRAIGQVQRGRLAAPCPRAARRKWPRAGLRFACAITTMSGGSSFEEPQAQPTIAPWRSRISAQGDLRGLPRPGQARRDLRGRVRLGARAKAIQELGGHESLTTTLRYMHLSPSARDPRQPRSVRSIVIEPAAQSVRNSGRSADGSCPSTRVC
jgi:hypothetical protein